MAAKRGTADSAPRGEYGVSINKLGADHAGVMAVVDYVPNAWSAKV